MRLARVCQAASFLVFLALVWRGAAGLPGPWASLFVRLDPVASATVGLAGRVLVAAFVPALVVVIVSVAAGRFFCSVLCPLGTTIDLVDRAGFWKSCRGCRGHRPSPRLRRIKYAILAVTLILGILGIQFASLVSPTVIATRLYGVVVYGPATQLFRYGIGAIRQVTHQAGAGVFEYVTLPLRTYDLLWPSLLVCGVTLAGTLATPRFWCRYLCPAGAVFALLSLRPLVLRRTVNASCTSCGACARACPMGAIGSDPMLTEHSECILCGNCASVCPESAVSFTAGPGRTPKAAGATPEGRRAFLAGVLAWSAVLLAGITALKRAMIAGFPERGHDAAPVRPPGSLPEKDFLAACIGCGACMAVCPTNTLQPAGVSSGLEGLFSPVVVPRRGPCDATCTACSTTCPTGAIRRLSPEDKPYAKMGTARIDRETCLAWAKDTACLICDEVCPYGAVDLVRAMGARCAVPVVDEEACTGCGYCEHHCPVGGRPAIVVTGRGAVRLREGPYRPRERVTGERPNGERPTHQVAPGDLPPGFSD